MCYLGITCKPPIPCIRNKKHSSSYSEIAWAWLRSVERPLSMSTFKYTLPCSEPSWLENSRALQKTLSTLRVCSDSKTGQSHCVVIWFSVYSQRHFCDSVFKYVKKGGMNLGYVAITTGCPVPFWQHGSPSVTVPPGSTAECPRTGCA